MKEFNDVKIMLLGIAIILFTIVIHLFLESGLITDFIAIIGLFVVFVGYKEFKDEEKTKLDKQSLQQEDINDRT